MLDAEPLKKIDPYHQRLAHQLERNIVTSGAFILEESTLTNGDKSPYKYSPKLEEAPGGATQKGISQVDLNDITNLTARLAVHDTNEFEGSRPDFFVGVPNTGIPFAEALGRKLKIPTLGIEKENPKWNMIPRINGVYEKGQKVVLADNTTTTGLSNYTYAKYLEAWGLEVVMMVFSLDRLELGRKNLEQFGYKTYAATTTLDVFKTGQSINQEGFTDEKFQVILDRITTKQASTRTLSVDFLHGLVVKR